METHPWKPLPVEVRRPHFVDVAVAGGLYLLLHQQPQIPEWVAVAIGSLALRCIRYRRTG